METFRKSVYCSLLGMILLTTSVSSYADVIWESTLSQETFNYSGYNSVFLSLALNSDQNDQIVLNAIKHYGKGKAVLAPIRDFHEQIYNAIGNAKLWLYCGVKRTEDPKILILQFEAKVPVKTDLNQYSFNATTWEKTFLMKDQTKINDQLENAIKAFLDQFLKTNSQASFHYIDLNGSS